MLKACKCKGTIIVPQWPSAVFWPVLSPGVQSSASFVVDSMYLPLVSGLFVKGKRGSCLFETEIPNTNVLALRLDFA